MPETTDPTPVRANSSAGHLSVHLEGAHPADVPFLFEQQGKRLGWSILTGFGIEASLVALLIFSSLYGERRSSAAVLPEDLNKNIVWLNVPGPGGGGGGGGNQMKDPPRQAELPGKEKITVPAVKPETPKLTKEEPNPLDQLTIPAKTMAAATDSLPGAIDVPGPPTLSQGSGTGGGSGTGSGPGIGPGSGSGLGPGTGGGTGGGAYRVGSGVTTPQLIKEVKPAYTADAMRAKIQGSVLVDCDVQPDGSVTNVKVIRSLDPTFGLDQEAMKAARQWRFRPGTLHGEPVAVTISIELTFTLR